MQDYWYASPIGLRNVAEQPKKRITLESALNSSMRQPNTAAAYTSSAPYQRSEKYKKTISFFANGQENQAQTSLLSTKNKALNCSMENLLKQKKQTNSSIEITNDTRNIQKQVQPFKNRMNLDYSTRQNNISKDFQSKESKSNNVSREKTTISTDKTGKSLAQSKKLRQTIEISNKIAEKIVKYGKINDTFFQDDPKKTHNTSNIEIRKYSAQYYPSQIANLVKDAKKHGQGLYKRSSMESLDSSFSEDNSRKYINEAKLTKQSQFKNEKKTQFGRKESQNRFHFTSPTEMSEVQQQNKNFSDFQSESPTFGIKKTSIQQKFNKLALQDFSLGNCKGEGRFGKVYPAIHKKTNFLCALKEIKKQSLKFFEDQFVAQLKLQLYLDHKHIVKIYGWFDTFDKIYILMEYMEEGSLFNLLKKEKQLSQGKAGEFLYQICKALETMHEKDIIHRDIKPQNIVLTNGMCKICDFGWAALCTSRRKTYCGTLDYVCPEILSGQEYDYLIDVWCIGVLAYELMTGKAPFYHLNQRITKQKIAECDFKLPEGMSESAKEFILKALKKDPKERMPMEFLLETQFLMNAEKRLGQ